MCHCTRRCWSSRRLLGQERMGWERMGAPSLDGQYSDGLLVERANRFQHACDLTPALQSVCRPGSYSMMYLALFARLPVLFRAHLSLYCVP